MSIPKPSIPKGTRDFGPVQMARRSYILDTIKDTFRLFGYHKLKTTVSPTRKSSKYRMNTRTNVLELVYEALKE